MLKNLHGRRHVIVRWIKYLRYYLIYSWRHPVKTNWTKFYFTK